MKQIIELIAAAWTVRSSIEWSVVSDDGSSMPRFKIRP
jgi:hypothetical protein